MSSLKVKVIGQGHEVNMLIVPSIESLVQRRSLSKEGTQEYDWQENEWQEYDIEVFSKRMRFHCCIDLLTCEALLYAFDV